MDKSEINQQMQRYIESGEMAGAALRIRKNGETVYQGKWGYADIQSGRLTQYDTIYRLASMSKPVTAVAVMKLEEQGKLKLDSPITEFLPGFGKLRVCSRQLPADQVYEPDPDHPAGRLCELPEDMEFVLPKRMVTVRDLLSHSSGLGMGTVGMLMAGDLNRRMDRLAERVEKWQSVPADFQPGEATGYSAVVGFDILGRIVEVVSGQEFNRFLEKEIFSPMGIRDITFTLNEDQAGRLSALYFADQGRLEDVSDQEDELKWYEASRNGYFSGSAGLYGSLEDYDKFVQMLADEGQYRGARILKAETVRKMCSEGAAKHLEMMPGAFWGLGMLVTVRPDLCGMPVAPGTYGWSGAYGTHFFINPEQKLQAVFVMNRSNIGGAGSPIARRVEKLTFGIYGER